MKNAASGSNFKVAASIIKLHLKVIVSTRFDRTIFRDELMDKTEPIRIPAVASIPQSRSLFLKISRSGIVKNQMDVAIKSCFILFRYLFSESSNSFTAFIISSEVGILKSNALILSSFKK